MNKTAIKNFATWARNKLIADITYKAGLLGVTEKGIASPLPQSTKDMQFFDIGTGTPNSITGKEIAQRKRLAEIIESKVKQSDYKTAFSAVVEEVAYTWFNRLIAVRFMEVNDYLPSRIRVLSSESKGKAEPDLVTTPFDTDLEFTQAERELIAKLKLDNKLDELFRMLFIKQCNALNSVLPELFEKTNDYTELLLAISYTDKDGVVAHLVDTEILLEDDFKNQVQIIGWMYQYYNSEPKDVLINARSKYKMDDIPFVTQLFTSDWIVRFMVDNTLGRLWLDGHPNSDLKSALQFYLDEAGQTPEVTAQLDKIRTEYKNLDPEEIRVIDPCMGSGHILVYAFDVLIQIYRSVGYADRDAANLILEKNLCGLDIDRRAYQLAYFSLMMKARQYNRRVFAENIEPQVYHPTGFVDGEEYGSLLQVVELDERPQEKEVGEQIALGDNYEHDLRVWNFKRLLAQKYDVVVTNPPYMNASYMPDGLKSFILENYSDYKADLFSAYFQQVKWLCKKHGHIGLLSPYVWMFISSHENARDLVVKHSTITSLVQLEYNAFEAACIPVAAFTMLNTHIEGLTGEYIRLSDFKGIEVQEPKALEAVNSRECGFRYTAHSDNFEKIPGCPIAYWVSEATYRVFDGKRLNEFADAKQGMATSDNNRFLRCWYELSKRRIGFLYASTSDALNSNLKWFPYNKGGDFRRWYGNCEFVVNWENDGFEIKNSRDEKGKQLSRPQSLQFMYKESLSWSKISNSTIAFRYFPKGFLFDVAGCSAFPKDNSDKFYLLGFVNSIVAQHILYITSPTMNYEVGHISNLPIIKKRISDVSTIVEENVSLSCVDWNSFETSWDFLQHPMVHGIFKMNIENTLSDKYVEASFQEWQRECGRRFNTLKSNEEELNRIFIDIYGLQDELTPDVADKDVTIARIYDSKDDIPESMKGNGYVLTKADVMKSFISYAVGCMFGRYSLDVEGLAYAGGEWDSGKYSSFIPDKDNVIPITDEEYYEDDIVGRFVDFVRVAFGAETLEDNLEFIAYALGNKGNSSREIIRNYFVNDFYKDHVKTYQKRPIYWLFDSGKQDGFKVLVYLHRYNQDTIGNLRIDYLHRIQRVYDSEIARMQDTIDNSANGREVAAAEKRKEKLQKQLKETKDYDAKIAHLALARIALDLDDGVKVNYEKVQTGTDGKKLEVLGKI